MAEVAPAVGSSSAKLHIVLVHGVCGGGWCWYKVAAWLQSSLSAAGGGCRVLMPDLATAGVDSRRLQEVMTFWEYTVPLLDVLRSLPDGEKAVLVGHSLGGLSVALATEEFPEKVATAVFLCAFMPDCTSPPSHVLQQRGQLASVPDGQRDETPRRRWQTSTFLQVRPAVRRTKHLPIVLQRGHHTSKISHKSRFSVPRRPTDPETTLYGSVHKVYIVCKQDCTLVEGFQRWMVSNNPVDEVKEIDSADHMAMLSASDDVARCILDVVGEYS